ncbi:MAG: toll/interleukin-1 receptor domain-containing protein [Hyphomonadaceae bacterium]|nr:toll/interleukin-1 receptor domain-containing protein [Hyphomonadaceae bacterium]
MDVGEDWAKRIRQELEEAKAIVVCWTPAACKSDWMKHEASVAAQRDILVPIILRACVPPALNGAAQSADLPDWEGASTDKQFLALLPPLERMTGRRELAARLATGRRARGRIGRCVAIVACKVS